jgi:hypothetical protein
MRNFYQKDVAKLLKTYDKFILINTNFHHVNAFSPSQNLFRQTKPGEEPEFGKAGRGLSMEFAQSLQDHKMALVAKFQKLIPELEKAFPEYRIILRHHPSENPHTYKKIAAGCSRGHVITKGNIVPWLLAAKALIHHGCTTGVEAYVLGVPAISYRTVINEDIDNSFYRLPAALSHQCFDFEQLRETLTKIFKGEFGVLNNEECKKIIQHFITAQNGPLASERIDDILEKIVKNRSGPSKPPVYDYIAGWYKANLRRFIKWFKSFHKGTHAPSEFHRHRYPGISLDELRRRALRFQQILDRNTEIKVEQIYDQIFRIRT